MRTKKRSAHAPQVQHHLVQQHKHLVSFHLQAQPANFWYSVSVFQFVGLTVFTPRHHSIWHVICAGCITAASTF
jgi:hypothetical protein